MKIYKPVRDSRFEYVEDALCHIEDAWCYQCTNRGDGEFPSTDCPFPPLDLVFGVQVSTILDNGSRLFCTEFDKDKHLC